MMNGEQEGTYTKGQPLPNLKYARFYTLIPFDIDNDGTLEWTGLGDEFRLHVWDRQGNVIWSGDKNLGGTNNAIAVGNAPRGDPPPRIMFHSRLLATDIDGDGSRDVVAIKNIPLVKHVANFRVYTKSNIVAYRVEGASLSPAWTTADIDWCLTDMQVHDHTLFLAAQKGKILNIGKESGQIMWFE
jgi:hypothetical protein